MFERFTELARRVVFFARYEATQAGAAEIGPEHLLLGLLRERRHVTPLLEAAGLETERFRQDIQQVVGRLGAGKVPTGIDMPMTRSAQDVLQFAIEEADRRRRRMVGAGELLIAITGVPSISAERLASAGVSLEQARRVVSEVETREPAEPHASPGTVHITVSTRPPGISSSRHLDHWSFSGLTLRQLLSEAHDVSISRIALSESLDLPVRYDLAATLAQDVDHEQAFRVGVLKRMVTNELATHFRVSASLETIATDVHVMTAPDGCVRARMVSPESGGGLGAMTFSVDETLAQNALPGAEDERRRLFEARAHAFFSGRPLTRVNSLSATGSTSSVCEMIERMTGFPVIDETGIDGTFEFNVRTESGEPDAFIAALREQTGLVLTPATRDLTFLVVRPV